MKFWACPDCGEIASDFEYEKRMEIFTKFNREECYTEYCYTTLDDYEYLELGEIRDLQRSRYTDNR